MNKIVICGTAGQGIKLLGYVLSNILKDQQYYVAFIYDYDAFVRGGKSNSYIVFSKEPIDNPIIDVPDIEYNLNDKKLQEILLGKYKNVMSMNMVLLGIILKVINLKMREEDIRKYLPKHHLEENLLAIMKGYEK